MLDFEFIFVGGKKNGGGSGEMIRRSGFKSPILYTASQLSITLDAK